MSSIIETNWAKIDVSKIDTFNEQDIAACFNFIISELNNYELEQQEINDINNLLSLNGSKINSIKKCNDLLKIVDIFNLYEKDPNLARELIKKLLMILGKCHPCFYFAGVIVSKLPPKTFNFFMQLGAVVDPIHILGKNINNKYTNELEKVSMEKEILDNLGDDVSKLIIVTKNISIGKELENLIITNDDKNDKEIVGTRDNTVQPIIINNQAWEKLFNNISNDYKILILGDVNHISKLTTNHIIFNKYGVRYGWNNNIAQIEVDYNQLKNKNDYEKFYEELINLNVSEKFKNKSNFKFNIKSIAEIALGVPFLIGTDIIQSNNAIKQQQLVYGLYNLYIKDLQKFIDE